MPKDNVTLYVSYTYVPTGGSSFGFGWVIMTVNHPPQSKEDIKMFQEAIAPGVSQPTTPDSIVISNWIVMDGAD